MSWFIIFLHISNSTEGYIYIIYMICWFFLFFTAVDDTSDSDSEIAIASRSTAEFNRADTVVHKLYINFF